MSERKAYDINPVIVSGLLAAAAVYVKVNAECAPERAAKGWAAFVQCGLEEMGWVQDEVSPT